jgi:cytochrome P450
LSCPDRRTRADAGDRELGLQVALEDGGVRNPVEVVAFGLLLLVAGNETTTTLIGNAFNALRSGSCFGARPRRSRSPAP